MRYLFAATLGGGSRRLQIRSLDAERALSELEAFARNEEDGCHAAKRGDPRKGYLGFRVGAPGRTKITGN